MELNLLEGNYTCEVLFNGNDLYNKTNNTFNVNVIKRNSKLIYSTETQYFYPNGPAVKVCDENGAILKNKSIIFTLNGGLFITYLI